MPEDPILPAGALARHDPTPLDGVVLRPVHGPAAGSEARDTARRTCAALRQIGRGALDPPPSARRRPAAAPMAVAGATAMGGRRDAASARSEDHLDASPPTAGRDALRGTSMATTSGAEDAKVVAVVIGRG